MHPGDEEFVVAAGHLFDEPPTFRLIASFLNGAHNHLCIAYAEGGTPVGFVSGIETLHPDKEPEMLLYELGVDETHRRRGIGRALTEALAERARTRGCVGMWVLTDFDNRAALATYRAAGADEPTPHVMFSWPIPR